MVPIIRFSCSYKFSILSCLSYSKSTAENSKFKNLTLLQIHLVIMNEPRSIVLAVTTHNPILFGNAVYENFWPFYGQLVCQTRANQDSIFVNLHVLDSVHFPTSVSTLYQCRELLSKIYLCVQICVCISISIRLNIINSISVGNYLQRYVYVFKFV